MTQTYTKISGAFASAVADDGTLVIAYPSGTSSADFKATGAKLWLDGLQVLLTQASDGTFDITHSSSMTLTNKSGSAFPAGTNFDLYLPTPQPGDAIADLTEDGSTIGGANDGDLPDLTATAATVAGTLTGSTDGTLADVAAIALSTSDTYADSAVNTAVNTAITSVNLQLKELQVALNKVIADNVALRAAIREDATRLNEVTAALADYGVIASS